MVDELPRFGDGVEREIIGIAQEALTNAVRHSRASRITIKASTVRSIGFRLSVADDGRGIARERVQFRIRHDEHAGARRAHRRIADDRHRAEERDRSRAGVGAVFRAHAGPLCKLTPSPVPSPQGPRASGGRSRAAQNRRREHHQPGTGPAGRRRGRQRRRGDRGLPAPSARRDAARPAHAGDGRRGGRAPDPGARPARASHHPHHLRHRRGDLRARSKPAPRRTCSRTSPPTT